VKKKLFALILKIVVKESSGDTPVHSPPGNIYYRMYDLICTHK
jgi:hypothetical protein